MIDMKLPSLLLLPLLLLSGCASYYSHYAMFPAENSAGEPRQVRLSWNTADYPGWWFADDMATPIRLETQCSERVWRLHDSSDDEAGACGDGIRACGEPGLDFRPPKATVLTDKERCMAVNPSEKGARIAGLGGKLELLVSCKPVSTFAAEGDEKRNIDYIRASSVPYTVYVRKAPRGSLRAKMPEFDESACDAE
ncbi:hypothetical protein KFJ24_07400 [Marinobacter sediminum]|uniref:hypothetical protein n=1 Tax=Marinobacter sediminum TaxID=256323 RepID=UPI00202FF091|nr:hypothetical protein [Marinobacter sediminum]MCM0612299.1 hypothetical protein [Marinobacter sediminum]